MMNCYIIDSSSLIDLNRHSPLDVAVFKYLWDGLSLLIKKGRLIAPEEVLNEIKQKDDLLSDWLKKHRTMFKEITPEQIKIAREILKIYPLSHTKRQYDADIWIIALAIEESKKGRTMLVSEGHSKVVDMIKHVVVTEEKLHGNKIKIPFICQKYNIEVINKIMMIRKESDIFNNIKLLKL